MPNSHEPIVKEYYAWKFDDEWSTCNKSCGKGYKFKTARCVGTKSSLVNDNLCQFSIKPEDMVEICNLTPCESE